MSKIIVAAATVVTVLTTKYVHFRDWKGILEEKHHGWFFRRAGKKKHERTRRLDLGQAFNNSNPHPEWCPSANCSNSPVCGPCNRRFLFIMATGRSGSTSLLRTMNALPNIRLSGENNNVLLGVRDMTKYLTSPFEFGEKRGAWGHGYMQRADLACPVQKLIEAIDPPTLVQQLELAEGRFNDSSKIMGFKTIRFPMFWPNDEEALEFINAYFPCARFIININSNIERQSKSGFHIREENAYEELEKSNIRLRSIAAKLGPLKAHFMDLVEWGGNASAINQMVSWLGYSGCKLQRVVHENDSSKGGPLYHDKNEINFGKDCHFEGNRAKF